MKDGPEGDTERAEVYGKFMALLKKHDREMNEFLFEVQDMVPSAHFSHLKLMVGKVLGHGHMTVLEEIAQKYPALKPDWMK